MKILVACEESQAVTIVAREYGHEAYSCDLIPCSGGHPEWHIQWDVLPLLDGDCSFATGDGTIHHIDGEWDMIIAFPPCTYMSKAGACRMYPKAGQIDRERFQKAQKAKEFFMKIYKSKCERICIENPTPLKIVGLPKESQVIQPYEHGHPFSKRTLLWTKNLKRLEPTDVIKKYEPWMPSNTSKFSKGGGGSRGKAHDPITAAKTFPGIARAMIDQWAGKCEE